MNYLYLLLALWLIPEEHFWVVNEPKNVYSKTLQRMLHRGDRITNKDSIRFSSSASVLVMAGPLGVMTRSATQESGKPQSKALGTWVAIKDAVLPMKVTGSMKARSGILTSRTEVGAFFERFGTYKEPLLILDTFQVPISTAILPDTAKQYFYLSYSLNGEVINKKIDMLWQNKSLFLTLNEQLFFVDGRYGGSDFIGPAQLHFFDSKSGSSTALSTFFIRYARIEELATDICQISQAMDVQVKNMSEIHQEQVFGYLRLFYGQFDELHFKVKYFPLIKCP